MSWSSLPSSQSLGLKGGVQCPGLGASVLVQQGPGCDAAPLLGEGRLEPAPLLQAEAGGPCCGVLAPDVLCPPVRGIACL